MPDVVLDALASIGLWGDGRLTALCSYENRVYQTKRVIWVFRSNVTAHSGLSWPTFPGERDLVLR